MDIYLRKSSNIWKIFIYGPTVDTRYKRTRYKRILAISVAKCLDICAQAILQAPRPDISVIRAIRVKRSKMHKTLIVNLAVLGHNQQQTPKKRNTNKIRKYIYL